MSGAEHQRGLVWGGAPTPGGSEPPPPAPWPPPGYAADVNVVVKKQNFVSALFQLVGLDRSSYVKQCVEDFLFCSTFVLQSFIRDTKSDSGNRVHQVATTISIVAHMTQWV